MPTVGELLKQSRQENEELKKQIQKLKERKPRKPKEVVVEKEVIREVIKEVPMPSKDQAAEISRLNREILKLSDANQILMSQKESIDSRMREAQSHKLRYQRDNVALSEKVNNLSVENVSLNEKLSSLLKRNNSLTNRVRELEVSLESRDNPKSQKPKLIVATIPSTFIRRVDGCFHRAERLSKENEALYDINHELERKIAELQVHEKYSEDVVKMFEEDNDRLSLQLHEYEEKIESLEGEIVRLKQTLGVEKLKSESKISDGIPVIVMGKEHDFYEGEHRDMVISALKEKLNTLEPYTRRHAVIKSLIDANPEVGTRDDIRSRIMHIFRNFNGGIKLSAYQKSELYDIGFQILPTKGCNGHCKLRFKNDDRYMLTIASTTNKGRGLNTASDLIKMIL